jgi:hypothetical protein
MNIFFWLKKNEEQKPRRFEVPREYVMKVRELQDLYSAAKYGKVEHYNFWSFIEEIIPDTKTGVWIAKYPTATRAEIVELFDDKDGSI